MSPDLFSLEGKIAVVTGGLGQLGRQFTLALAGRGAGWRLHGEPDGALSLERRDAPR